MKKSLTVSRDELTSETDYDCTYCENSENVESCRVDEVLELLCTNCGRHGRATVSDGIIDAGPFFSYLKG